jgi:uncharacterized protein (TIGR03437 family)
MIKRFVFAGMLAAAVLRAQGTITTVAGTGSVGDSGDGGQATSATIGTPNGVVVDKAGNLYIADSIYSVVRKVNPAGIISTIAGGPKPSLGDGGPATGARLVVNGIHTGMAFDNAGNLYITDYGDSRIRKIDALGTITTVVGSGTSLGVGGFSGDGGPATSAQLNSPTGVAFDSAGNMYIADFGNCRIRKVNTSGIISTIAGIGFASGSDTGDGGPATSATLTGLIDLAVDGNGNVYISDNEHVRIINSAGTINTAAHGFFGTCSLTPTAVANADVAASGLAIDSSNNLYIADRTGGCIQVLETNGFVTTVAGGGTNLNGDGGPAASAAITPTAVALDATGNIYIATTVYKVRKVAAGSAPPSALPIISSANGVVNGGSFVPGIAPNTWVTIYGLNFSTQTGVWTVTNGVLPTSVNGVSVTFDGLPGYVSYVSPTQINVLTPPNLTSQFPMVVVTNSVGSSAPALAFSSTAMPAFFTWPNNQVVATHADYSWAVANGTFPGVTTVPAKPGETIILWGTGFGPTTPAAPVGAVVPSTATYSTTLPSVQVNLVGATVYGAALAPGFGGLYQLAFQVPPSLTTGTYQVIANFGAPATNNPMLAVHP